MKELFHIESGDWKADGEKALWLRVGERHCAMAITNPGGRKVYKLLYCSFDPLRDESLETFLSAHPETAGSFSTIALCYDCPAAMPAPIHPATEDKSWTDFFYETGETEIKLAENISGKQMQMIYAAPAVAGLLAGRKFNGGKYWHQYTIALHAIGDAGKEGILRVDFRPDEFVVTAASGQQVLLTQTFPYAVPEDVIYYLLKICRHHGLSQQQVKVELSGLIDKASALYKELYQYFLQVSFREADWDLPPGDYPAHYFTSLNDLARCAL